MTKIEEMIKKGRTIRTMNTDIAARSAEDGSTDDSMIVEGYASTFNEVYELGRYFDAWKGEDVIVQEQVDPHAFDEADMSDVCFYYNHHDPVLARHKGKGNDTLQLSTDDHGLKVTADLSRSANGKDCYTNIRNGLIDQMSFAFTVNEDKTEQTEDRENHTLTILRTITKIGKVYDVSAVDLPANDGTDISARSYCDGVIQKLTAERLEAQKKAEARKRLKLKIEMDLRKD